MKKDSFKNTTRGGQTLLHNLRMINQVMNQVLFWCMPFGVMVMILWFLLATTPFDRYMGRQYATAQFNLFFGNKHVEQDFALANGHTQRVYSLQVITAPFMQDSIDSLEEALWHAFLGGLTTYGVLIIATSIWLQRRGGSQSKAKHVRGDRLGDVKEVHRLQKKQRGASDLVFGEAQLTLPRYAEIQHFLVVGTTGVGKSHFLRELLYHIRRRGEKAIIYDKSGNFIEEFYEPELDHILNGFDDRTVSWSLWKDCRDKAEFETYAAAQIPMPLSSQDPFWINAARTIFAEVAFQMRREKNPRILSLLRRILTVDMNELKDLLKDTVAEALSSDKIEKTAISIKSVLANYLKSMTYIKEDDQPFSIREWVHNDEAQSWLFLSSVETKHESIRPLISAWFDIAVNELLSLKRSDTRRLWFILDEATSLNKLPSMRAGLAEMRKFGGCMVLSILSHAEMSEVYGERGMQAISNLLNTRLFFRAPDPDVAEWSSRNLGEAITEEVREGISYGANTMRDGISINRVETTKRVVIASDLMKVDYLHCYVRLPGNYPITPLRFEHQPPVPRNMNLIPREFEQDNLRQEITQLMDAIEKQAPIATVGNAPPPTATNKQGAENAAKPAVTDIHKGVAAPREMPTPKSANTALAPSSVEGPSETAPKNEPIPPSEPVNATEAVANTDKEAPKGDYHYD